MCESPREQRPLLYEEVSEDDLLPHHCRLSRRLRLADRTLTREKLRGAASIITRWPDHWSSSVLYWWVAIGMIALITLIVYNSVVAFAILPPNHASSKTIAHSYDVKIADESSTESVFMHMIVDNNQKVDLHSYMPYIKVTAETYPKFSYYFIVLLNDTTENFSQNSDDKNNQIAMKSILSDNPISEKAAANIKIQYLSLSNYLDSSPLRDNWRHLPNQFLPFLVRAVSVWEKGGIAFNPIVLTPNSPSAIYFGKIRNILSNYGKLPINKTDKNQKQVIKNLQIKPREKKINNIRDIIEAFENKEDLYSQHNLTEAEDKNSLVVTRLGRALLSLDMNNNSYKKMEKESNEPIRVENKDHFLNKSEPDMQENKPFNRNEIEKPITSRPSYTANDTAVQNSTLGLLPLFLDYIFNGKTSSNRDITEVNDTTPVVSLNKHKSLSKSNKSFSVDHLLKRKVRDDRRKVDKYKPMIISVKDLDTEQLIENNIEETSDSVIKDIEFNLVVDLKGNLIATEIPCHAFIGTAFSNSVHHGHKESLTDFLIVELSTFCNGLLSSCKGIDVILI